jgi:hypothetical protein
MTTAVRPHRGLSIISAWTNGELLWRLRATPRLQADYLAHLDQFASFTGSGLLVPRLGLGAGA